jgi:NAD+ kinase
MSEPSNPLRNIAVLAHPQLPAAIAEIEPIAEYLRTHGVHVTGGLFNDDAVRRQVGERTFDLVIALGGDGTMLRAGHLCAPHNTPILGINLGRFGFLTELQQDQWPKFLPRLLEGRYWLEERMMLHAEHRRVAEHRHAAEHQYPDEKCSTWDVLNEVVVMRGAVPRPIHLSAEVDGQTLTTYVADALIAATPTGSTAYALAAGGPILPPTLRNILLVPVAPHLSVDRAIVLAEGSSVSITIIGETPAVFSVDGQPPVVLPIQDRVHVRAGDHVTQFVRFQDPGYFYRNLTPHMNHNPATTGSSR